MPFFFNPQQLPHRTISADATNTPGMPLTTQRITGGRFQLSARYFAAALCPNAHRPDRVSGLMVSNEGDTTMIAIFALGMMAITAGFAVPALLPVRNSR